MNIDKNMKNSSVVSSATYLYGYDRNTCPLNVFHEADNINKNMKFKISLPSVCPLPTSPPRLTGHHIPPLEPTPMMI